MIIIMIINNDKNDNNNKYNFFFDYFINVSLFSMMFKDMSMAQNSTQMNVVS